MTCLLLVYVGLSISSGHRERLRICRNELVRHVVLADAVSRLDSAFGSDTR